MGNFWDQFVFRVCVGLGEEHSPQGFRSAASLLERAHSLGLLRIDERLNPLSLLLIVLACPHRSAAHQQAFDEASRRGLEPRQAWEVLREALPPRLTDLLLLSHFGEKRQQALVSGIVHELYVPSLVRFCERLALCPAAVAEVMMTPFVREALRPSDGLPIPDGEFLCHLYRQVRERMRDSDPKHRWDAAKDWPTTPLPWRDDLDRAEEVFLNRCLRLDVEDRCLLYLSFYARLNAKQIRCIYQDNRNLRVQDVVEMLSEIWARLLPDLE